MQVIKIAPQVFLYFLSHTHSPIQSLMGDFKNLKTQKEERHVFPYGNRILIPNEYCQKFYKACEFIEV